MKKGYIYAVVSALLFGTAGLFVRGAQKTGLDSAELLIFQYIIAVVIMFGFAFYKDSEKLCVTKKQLLHLAVLGIIGNTFMTIFYYNAFEYINVAMVTMLLFTYPVMVFIYSVIFQKQKIDIKKVLAILLAFIGCGLSLNLFSGKMSYSVKGVIFGLLSAVFYAFMNLYSEEKLEQVDALSINAYSTLFSLISIIIYKHPGTLLIDKINSENLIYILILSVVCEIVPLTLLYKAIQYIGSVRVSIIGNLEIPVSILVSVIILREHVSILQIFGTIMIIYSVYIIKNT